MVTYKGPSGEVVSGRADLVSRYAEICREQAEEQDKLKERLIAEGFAAAHPNDGWVDRENLIVTLAYPWFKKTVDVGSRIALISQVQGNTVIKDVRVTKILSGLNTRYQVA